MLPMKISILHKEDAMRRLVVCMSILTLLLGGCSRDESNWQKARSQNSAKGYMAYMAENQDGAHISEAKGLTHKRLFSEAKAAEKERHWRKAAKLWDMLYDFDQTEEALSRNIDCEVNADNPINVDTTVKGVFTKDLRNPDLIPYTHQLRVEGTLENISWQTYTRVVLRLELFANELCEYPSESQKFEVLKGRQLKSGQKLHFSSLVKVDYSHILNRQRVVIESSE